MGAIKEPKPVKLIASMFTRELRLFDVAQERLSERFGPVDYESQILPFDHTTYYAAEFGENLQRKFVSFAQLIDPGELAAIKRWTNELEMELALWNTSYSNSDAVEKAYSTGLTVEGKRRINLDPGYLSLSKLVLATTKDWQHRLYLGQGIYAEVTLRYRKGSFQPWEWTYPDYRSPEYIAIFNHIRQLYTRQLREG
ncbi:MAG: DUF4416 family protein [Anaerolineae bacterium]